MLRASLLRVRIPETRYATTADGLSIAYQQFGEGGPDVIWVTGTASHIELFWELPGWAHTLRHLSSFSRVIWFDKRGTGLSDRSLGSATLEDRMEDIRAVMDAAGVESAILIGLSESGPMSALFAATWPERVRKLALVASWASGPADPATTEFFATHVSEVWGDGSVLEAVWARGIPDRALLGRIERAMGTPKSMAALIRVNAQLDVRPILPLVRVPALVVNCSEDPIVPVERGRELAALLPNSQYVEIDANFHGSGRPEEMSLYGDALERFILGERRPPNPPPGERVLATVLFTDIVGSTERAASLGDARWSTLLDEHDRACARAVVEARGRIVKMTGDGLLATFEGPASAIAAAHRLRGDLELLGISTRGGIHTGEVERRGEDIGGIGVHLAARVMSAAADGEVWVSSTVPGLTVGADVAYESRGVHVLKGVPGEWELFATRLT